MSEFPQQSTSLLCDRGLAQFVEQSALAHVGNDYDIVSIERRLNDYHSSFAIEELTVHFENGRRLPLIFKNLSPDGLLAYARQIRPHFSYQSAREIIVYRHVLAGAGLGDLRDHQVAILVGADPEGHRPTPVHLTAWNVGPLSDDRQVILDLAATDVVPVATQHLGRSVSIGHPVPPDHVVELAYVIDPGVVPGPGTGEVDLHRGVELDGHRGAHRTDL